MNENIHRKIEYQISLPPFASDIRNVNTCFLIQYISYQGISQLIDEMLIDSRSTNKETFRDTRWHWDLARDKVNL